MKLVFNQKVFWRMVETQVLVFPILVLLVASLTFFCGGAAAAWQWWLGVAATCLIPFVRRENHGEAIASGLLFLAILIIFKLSTPLFFDLATGVDTKTCHLPMVRMFMKGWNPVFDPLGMEFMRAHGLEAQGMCHWHIAFCTKPAALFAAIASFFTHEPLALQFAPIFFLSVGVLSASMRLARPYGALVGLALWLIILEVASEQIFVDKSLLLACAGLLLTMTENLREKRLLDLPMVVFLAWMLSLKAPGLIAGVLFFGVFAVVFFRQSANRVATGKNLLAIAGSAMLIFACVSYSPYVAAYKATAGQNRPNLLQDFDWGNDDWKAMGYVGRYVNAYISPTLARAYYNNKFERADFKPHQFVWDYLPSDKGCASPLTFARRAVLLATFAALCILPGYRGFAVMMLLISLVFPSKYIGFMRYQLWFDVFALVAAFGVISRLADRWRGVQIGVVGLSGFLGLWSFKGFIADNAMVMEELDLEIRNLPKDVYVVSQPSFEEGCISKRCNERPIDGIEECYSVEVNGYINNYLLLQSQDRLLSGKEIIPVEQSDQSVRFHPKGLRRTRFGFYVPGEEGSPTGEVVAARSAPLREKIIRVPLSWLRAWMISYPRILFRERIAR